MIADTIEITTLTEKERQYFESLQGGCDPSPVMNKEYEEKVIIVARALAMNELSDDCGLSIFITHNQDLQIWVDKGKEYHLDDMKEVAEIIADRLKMYFGFDFEIRQISTRSIGMIIAEEQTTSYHCEKNKGNRW